MKKILSLCLVLIFCLGTVANAQEITGVGVGTVPVEYSSVSTFTVVLPDSLELGATKTQEFEVYLSDYELNDGDRVRVKPATNTIVMENTPKEIEYLVSSEATSYEGLAAFPKYYSGSTSQGSYYYVFKDYILTKQGSTYVLYGIPKGQLNNTRLFYSTSNLLGNATHRIVFEGNYTRYKDINGTSVDEDKTVVYPNTDNFVKYIYNEAQNTWVYQSYGIVTNSDTIIQSTLPIYIENTSEPFVQYAKAKDDIAISITMENEYLTDDTHVKGVIDGTNLTSGDWDGEVLFEITLE